MDRRTFLRIGGMGVGVMLVPDLGLPRRVYGALGQIATADKKVLADVALNAAKGAGATYADVRIGRYLNQFVFTREKRVQNIVDTESFGAGVRVIADGTWGFSSTNDVTKDGIAAAAKQAVEIAKANAKIQDEAVQLVPTPALGDVTWKTPIEKNAMEVPIAEKVELLMAVNAAATKAGASFINSSISVVNEQKFFASTDGSYIEQDIHRIYPNFQVTVTDSASGKFKTRAALSAPVGLGYEYLTPRAEDTVAGVTPRYKLRYDMIQDATAAAEQAKALHTAKAVEPGKYDLVLDPTHLWLTIHESVGHPLELDRVLGYEANFAGTSFATLDKWKSKTFNYGSKLVNFVADKLQPGSLGAVGYDDEGVKTKQWDLVKDGILVNYEAIRDQAHIIGEKESHGCCYADSWASVQFQRMPNVSLQAGKTPLSVDDLIKDVEKGIYIIGNGSFSIDQQRYNFQFGGQVFYEIQNGKIAGPLRDVAYQSNTQEFWNSCVALADQSDYRLGGSFFDGKGEPSQSSAVSHGCATTRFNGVNVINTERKI